MSSEVVIPIAVALFAQIIAGVVGSAFKGFFETRPTIKNLLLITFPLTVFVVLILWWTVFPKTEKSVQEARQAREFVEELNVTHVDMRFSTNPNRDGQNFQLLAADTTHKVFFELPENAEILTVWQSLISRNGVAIDDAAFDPKVNKDKKGATIKVTVVDGESSGGSRGGRATLRIYALYTIKPAIE